MFDQLFTNILADGEVAGYDPDADNDWFLLGDYTTDRNYWNGVVCDVLRSLDYSGKDCYIIKGGVVSDSGGGQIDISAGIGITKDSSGNSKLVRVPALSNIDLPSGWKDNRQIWVVLDYDYKYGAATRQHYSGTSYHYQLYDTYKGDPDGKLGGSTDSLFVDSDPNSTPDTVCCLRSFRMSSGNVFTDLGERTEDFAIQLGTDNSTFFIDKSNVRTGIGTSSPQQTLHLTNTTIDADTGIRLENDVQIWELKNTGFVDDSFRIRDITNSKDIVYFEKNSAPFSLAIKTSEIVINEDGANIDFRVESDDNANMFFVNAELNRIGIGTNNPSTCLHIYEDTTSPVALRLQNSEGAYDIVSDANGVRFFNSGTIIEFEILNNYRATFSSDIRISTGGQAAPLVPPGGIHIKTGASGITALDASANDFFIESVGDTGLTIGAGTSSTCTIAMGDSGNSSIGSWLYDNSDNSMSWKTNNIADQMTLDNAGNLTIKGSLTTGGGAALRTKIIDIGDWNMDTTVAISVAHGLADYTKVRTVFVMIRNDSSGLVNFEGIDDTNGQTWGSVSTVGTTTITLRRTTGSEFDTTDFNSTSFNRGWITIQYTD